MAMLEKQKLQAEMIKLERQLKLQREQLQNQLIVRQKLMEQKKTQVRQMLALKQIQSHTSLVLSSANNINKVSKPTPRKKNSNLLLPNNSLRSMENNRASVIAPKTEVKEKYESSDKSNTEKYVKNGNSLINTKSYDPDLKKERKILQQNVKKRKRLIKEVMSNRMKYNYKNRILVNGMKFVSSKGGSKLSLVSISNERTGKEFTNVDDFDSVLHYDGNTYIKQVTGNYMVENYTKSMGKKEKEDCIYYTRSGNCTNLYCKFRHSPGRIALCPNILSRKNKLCKDPSCKYSHKPSQYNSEYCKFFQSGQCSNENCIYTHKLESKDDNITICREFSVNGYCDDGLRCKFKHCFECPDFQEYGYCLRGRSCLCLHSSNPKFFSNNQNSSNGEPIRNQDNDHVIQFVYDSSESEGGENITASEHQGEGNNNSDSDDDHVQFIVNASDAGLVNNADYVNL